MEQSKVDLFIATNASKFKGEVLPIIKQNLEKMSDDKYLMMQSVGLKDPTTILLIAIFLGWERLFLEDIGLGILKILTCQGLGIWWLIDIFTASDRAKDFNFRKFMSLNNIM